MLGIAETKRLVLFLIALHDIGKFSEAFQGLVQEVLHRLQEKTSSRPYHYRHDALGLALWDQELFSTIAKRGVFRCDGLEVGALWDYLVPGVGPFFAHHGYPVYLSDIWVEEQFSNDDVRAASEFADSCAGLFLDEPIVLPGDLNELYDALKVQSWLFSGFVILCDWIGSNVRLFPHCSEPMALGEYWETACTRAEHAVREAGILPVPVARFSGIGSLFPSLKEVRPSPLQAYLTECELPAGPQLWIIEDITGSGKTEAAILLAHRLMEQGSEGIFIALPTMATANAMYDRMAEAYRRLFLPGETPSLALAHGRRDLMDGFTESIMDLSNPGLSAYSTRSGEEPTEGAAACSEWIADNKKKTFLAHAGVGTIDQALLAVLPSRHHTLRIFGLANKVLIVDEVHACDAYMAELLKVLLEFHAALGGSAILLSATIPQAMRASFAAAFLKGLNSQPNGVLKGAFPAITAVSCAGIDQAPIHARPDLRRSLTVTLVHEEKAVIEQILSAAASGACVCWVRNTVDDAVRTYELLARGSLVDSSRLMLFHARFAMGHRLDVERDVLKCFGKHAAPESRRGAILIATQVVEQSLDLDFDFMISDLAPIDLLIQRAGRIHRHHREFRGDRVEPVLWVLSPPVTESPARDWISGFLPGGASVYPDHGNLWRTARLLAKQSGWTMPDHARGLIEGVYGDEAEDIPEGLMKGQLEAEGKRRAEASQGRFNALSLNSGYGGGGLTALFSDRASPTRLGEPTVTFRLAVRSGEKILPICDRIRHTWMLSEVQVRESLLARSASTEDEQKQAAATMTDSGKWSELIILEPEGDDRWRGVAYDAKSQLVEVLYSSRAGLKVIKGRT
jgi:CRISPR-associated endonuclease/helicase Cas3